MLPEVVRAAARRYGELPAFVAPGGWRLSYGELDRLSDEAAAGLVRLGLGPGRVLGLLLPSTPDYAVAYVAAAKAGAVTAGVNPRFTAPERTRALGAVGPDLVLATPQLADGVETEAPVAAVEPAAGAGDILRELRVPGGRPPPLGGDPDRPVAIVLTSGTTGAPKGALFCNRQLAAISRMEAGDAWGPAAGGAPMLSSTELVHVGFMTKLPWYLRLGHRIHLLGRWRAAEALRVIAEERIPQVGAIPSQLALMLREPDVSRYDFSCVRMVVVGGGPSPPGLLEEAKERFGAPCSVRYSSTESGGLGTLTAADAEEEEVLFTVGRPRPGVELEVRDPQGRPLPPGEVGEVCLRSPAVMSGYWRDPGATAEALRGGWLHTGDLGFLDGRGCLRLVGRKKEMFIRGGYNVYPAEVEAVLSQHPGVAEVAVIPRPDPVMGEVGVAVVVPADPARPPSLGDLRAFAGERLAGYKLPEELRLVEALPLTPMHKVDRRRLAEEVVRGRGG